MGTLFRGPSFDRGVVFLCVTEISDLIFIKKTLTGLLLKTGGSFWGFDSHPTLPTPLLSPFLIRITPGKGIRYYAA